jgi:hypothetical protein
MSGNIGGIRVCNGVCDSGIGGGRRDDGRSGSSADNYGLVRDGNLLDPGLNGILESSGWPESDLVCLQASAVEVDGTHQGIDPW